MKNVGWLLAKRAASNNTIFDTFEPVKINNVTSHRQSRFYGPLLGFLLTNVLSNSAIAKYAPFGFLRVTYDPAPWIAYNKPDHNSYNHYPTYQNSWKPIHNPSFEYGPPQYITEHPVTDLPQSLTTEPTHIYHHHHFNRPSQQQIVNIYDSEHKPTEIIIDAPPEGPPDSTGPSGPPGDEEDDNNEITTNIEPPHNIQGDTIAEQSELREKKVVKRGISSKYYYNRRSKPRRKYNTTPDYFYDSYEDFSTIRVKARRKSKPRRPQNSYEDESYDDYDSFEYTTKPYNRRKKRPTQRRRNKYKNKRRPDATTADYDYDDYSNAEQVRPRQETTSSTTTEFSTSTETSTTESTTTDTTITTGSTVPSTTTQASAGGYGYGPSNGNEGVSFTYGPPQRPLQPAYGPPRPPYGGQISSFYNPFFDWRSQPQTRNSVVKKVHNIVGFEDEVHRFE